MYDGNVVEIIQNIKEAQGAHAKMKVIEEHQNNPVLRRVFQYAMNPFYTYGVGKETFKKIDETATREGGEDFLDFHIDVPEESFSHIGQTETILNALRGRRLSGNNAEHEIALMRHNLLPSHYDLFKRICTKHLDIGITAKTVNKVIPKLIPAFDCMLAHKYEKKRISEFPVYVEPKLDGIRALCFIDSEGGAKFFTRTGKPINTVNEIRKTMRKIYDEHLARSNTTRHSGFVFDGEIVNETFLNTVGSVRKKDEQAEGAVFHVFDMINMITFTEMDHIPHRTKKRRESIENFFKDRLDGIDCISVVPQYTANSFEEIDMIYNNIRADGGEGVIVKNVDGTYDKRRSHNWLKIKGQETLDLRVVDYFEGTGKYEESLGGLVVAMVDDEGNETGVTVRVGGGFTDLERENLWDNFLNGDPDRILGKLIEVEFHERTPDGSLRHPRFVCMRHDKS